MGLLIHYCTTSGKETIIRPSKHKTADAARDSAEDLRKTMRGQGGADKWRPDGTDRWINDKGDVVKLTEDKPGEAKWTHYDEDGQVAGSGNSESSLFATLWRIRSAKRGQARSVDAEYVPKEGWPARIKSIEEAIRRTSGAERKALQGELQQAREASNKTADADDKKTSYFSANTTEQGADAHKKARSFIAEKEGDGFIAYESTYGNHGFSVTYWKKESKTGDVMARFATDAASFAPGDSVHLGFGAAGGAGFSGKVVKVENGVVTIKNDEGRTFKGPVANVTADAKTTDVMAGVTPSGHRFQGTGLRCDRCGRPRSAHFVAGEKEVEKTGDADLVVKKADDTVQALDDVNEAARTYERAQRAQKAGKIDAEDLADAKAAFYAAEKKYDVLYQRDKRTAKTESLVKATDSALDLGYPVNREWVRLSDAMAPADAAKELAAKFTPEQMDAWRANY